MSKSTERYLQGISSRLNDRRATGLESESETLYRDIFEQLPVSIWVEDWSAAKVEIDRFGRTGLSCLRFLFHLHSPTGHYDEPEILP
jgi:hypothetical protein